jgi:hypothetical protein
MSDINPARRLAKDIAKAADVALDPFTDFVAAQRQLADQMAAWAELQHQLADQMAAWAKAQRHLAAAFELWLTPAAGAARATTRTLHRIAGDDQD